MTDSPYAFGGGIASLAERQNNSSNSIRLGPPPPLWRMKEG